MAPRTYSKEDEIEQHAGQSASTTGGTNRILDAQQLACEQVCAAETDKDEGGNAIGVTGMKWETLLVKKLQTICAHLGFKGYQNANKVGTIEIIVRCCKAKKVYDSLWDDKSKNVVNVGATTRNEVQCVFCLLSNDCFQTLLLPTLCQSETLLANKCWTLGSWNKGKIFWEQGQKIFVDADNNPDYNCLQFMEDEVFCDQEHFNSSQVFNHNREKLQTMWKGVNSECSKAVLTRFTCS